MPPASEHKVDVDKVWLRAKQVGPIVVATAAIVALYFGVKGEIGDKHRLAMEAIRDVIASVDRKSDVDKRNNDDLVRAVTEVRDEVRRLVIDSVAVRQAQAWIELFRALNAEKFPELKVPDLPR